MGCVGSKNEAVIDHGKAHPTTAVNVQNAQQPILPAQPLYTEAPPAQPATLTAGPPVAASPGRQEVQGAARRDAYSDDDSDWDNCSTSNCNLDPDEKKDPDGPGVGASVVQMAQHSSIVAESLSLDAAPYKETTTLRIDKVKGCMFVNQYLVVKFLGRGACGKVFLCLNTMDLRLYAMKAVRKVDLESNQSQQTGKPRRNPMEDLKREIMIMKKMKHINIVTLSEVIDDPAGSKLLLVMEFMEGGPVLTREALEKRERVPEALALQYFRDMVKALDYLHCHKVVHGDLKPENVLMAASGDVKLSDFGCSKVFATGNEYLERCNGTPAFLAPEMMKPNTRYRGRPTDVYALGACLYTLVFGRIPFSAPNLYKLFQVVQNEPVKFLEDVPITDSLRNLLTLMLAKNPKERITLGEIMQHPWSTMSNRFPLRSFRDLKPGETQEQHEAMPSGLTFAQAMPKPDLMSGLATLSKHERTFAEGDVILKQGDPGTYLLYIVSGTVDILVRWNQAPRRQASSTQVQSMNNSAQRLSTVQGTAGRTSNDTFMEESESTMTPITDAESQEHRMNLIRSAAKARDFIRSLQSAAGSARELLIAQRGPGELLGEMALFNKSLSRYATVRCASRVTARIITHEQLADYLAERPLEKHLIREGIWNKESEITMVEALVKLANVHDLLESSLEAMGLSAPPMSGQLQHLAQHHVVQLQMLRQQAIMQQQQQHQLQQQHYQHM